MCGGNGNNSDDKKDDEGVTRKRLEMPDSLDRLPFMNTMSDATGISQVLFGILLGLIAASALTLCAQPAFGGSSQCEFIKEPDRRHYCRAVSIPRPSECEFIKDTALRIECRYAARKR